MLLRPFLNMSALFLTNMVSDSGANVGPCWNSQLLQRISTNIQESATNKINIITRERERKRERKRKEKTIAPPHCQTADVYGGGLLRAQLEALLHSDSCLFSAVLLGMAQGTSRHDSLAEWSKALASGASPQGRGFEPHSCQCLRRAPAPSRLERSTDSAVHDWHAPLASASVATACTQWGWSALDMCECCSMPLEPCHCWFCCELKCNHRGIS
jgi:hypothetical protein